ncbi:sodium/nucleoside cotransporter 2-like [Ornithodoros turicata]|uniref:sodium/nucleoside cotransporter 2-like n=1 Tax=Ornithodoros turicata TaxID=34597 RepID=UPI003139303B
MKDRMMPNGDIELAGVTKIADGFYTNPDFVDDEKASAHAFEDQTPKTKRQSDEDVEDAPRWRRFVKPVIIVVLVLAYNCYLAAGIVLTWHKTKDYCHDVKFLTVVTCLVYGYALLKLLEHIYRRHLKKPLKGAIDSLTCRWLQGHSYWVRISTWVGCWTAVLAFLIYDCLEDASRMISVAGALVLIFLGFVFSKHRKHVNWYQVMWGMMLQFLMGLVVLRWKLGRAIFMCIGDKVAHFLSHASAGANFVFGHLATGINLKQALGVDAHLGNLTEEQNKTEIFKSQLFSTAASVAPVFVFSALPVIFFFSFIVSILYYVGAMQWLVLRVGWLLQVTVGTTVCESMTAAANIFLGMSEAPLMIHPFLAVMTKSELHTVMTGGFATIAGSVMAAYIKMGVSASHLLTASIMSAPAALAFSKLLYPEVEDSKTQSENIKLPKSEETNVLEAACNGTIVALTILGFIVANLIGFLAFLAFLNGTLLWFGNIVGIEFLTFEWVLGQVFRPLAYIMGVPWVDCGPVGELLGVKTFANEFIAYAQLGRMKSQLQERSVVIATYALCGFSNVGSVGIVLGSLGALCPERKADLSAIAVRALCAGSAACFITACIAGSLIS